jgi:hypothetical protein
LLSHIRHAFSGHIATNKSYRDPVGAEELILTVKSSSGKVYLDNGLLLYELLIGSSHSSIVGALAQ